MRPRFVLSLVVLVVLAAVPSAVAAGTTPQPLIVSASSLTQSGTQLVWKLQLARPFSPEALKAAKRSLCLLFERRDSAATTGRLCVLGPRPGRRAPRLAYTPQTRHGPGRTTVIDATVSRHSTSQLTASFVPTTFGVHYETLRWQVLSTLTAPTCPPVTGGGTVCESLFPRHPSLAPLHAPRLVGCTDSGAPFVYNGPSTGKMIALTFDDGPWYQTPQFLTLLEHYHVPATFFEIGEQISTYGQGGAIERRMLADGDMIGDHTWTHANVSGGGSFAAGEIGEAAAAIRHATGGFEPCLFRAPYGAVSPALLATATSMGFKTIQWNIDPRDWARPGVGEIESNVLDNARPGGIVEMHDGGGDRSETLAALPTMIGVLRSRGYQFVTITHLLGMKLIYR